VVGNMDCVHINALLPKNVYVTMLKVYLERDEKN